MHQRLKAITEHEVTRYSTPVFPLDSTEMAEMAEREIVPLGTVLFLKIAQAPTAAVEGTNLVCGCHSSSSMERTLHLVDLSQYGNNMGCGSYRL